jgi:hypothetical protein
MAVIGFPAQQLSREDEAAIVSRLQRDGHYACRRETGAAGEGVLALVDRERRERGKITKRHGVFTVEDPRGHIVLRTRRLDEVLQVLDW